MFAFEASEVTPTDPARIWALLADVARWPEWNPGVVAAALDGPLAPGSEGHTRAQAGPRSRLVIVEVDPGRRLVTDTIVNRAARLRFEHELVPEGANAVRVVHRVAISGLAAPIYGRTVGPRLRASIPAAVSGLVGLAATEAV